MKYDPLKNVFSELVKHPHRFQSNSILHQKGVRRRMERSHELIFGDVVGTLEKRLKRIVARRNRHKGGQLSPTSVMDEVPLSSRREMNGAPYTCLRWFDPYFAARYKSHLFSFITRASIQWQKAPYFIRFNRLLPQFKLGMAYTRWCLPGNILLGKTSF